MWLLESLWSPVGNRAYVTFMVDPMAAPSRKKGEAVWAVKASLNKLTGPFSAEYEFTLSLGQGWKERLPDFFQHQRHDIKVTGVADSRGHFCLKRIMG